SDLAEGFHSAWRWDCPPQWRRHRGTATSEHRAQQLRLCVRLLARHWAAEVHSMDRLQCEYHGDRLLLGHLRQRCRRHPILGNLHPARLSAVGQLVVYERFSGHGARLGPLLERCGPDQLRDAVVWPDLLSGAGHFRRQLYLLNRGPGLHSNTAQPPARVSLHPDEALNWLYFAHDDYHAAGFLPEPKQWSNPGWNEVLEEQWRWWSRELLKQTVGDLDGSPATSLRIGRDAPGFGGWSRVSRPDPRDRKST